MNRALGMIEVVGFACAVNISDVMVKTADVTVIGIEKAKGAGWLTVKVLGDVGAVNAAVESGVTVAKKDQAYIASKVIPRLGDGLEIWLENELDTSTNKSELKSEEIIETTEISEAVHTITSLEKEVESDGYTCNLCKDSDCKRKKGEPRKECSHYAELKEETIK
ncbi:BMC domain-containing protein [Vagococcus hydrophili]|uniref:BMC domain-containing protein n=1 Tax=Vagococcus hydrophili TaxID=2714947 RepID=A0A6G8AQE5_9ENTE|nr:BMC domain-containing protein [Vagococcus hydrophili]QIL47162.1 BMC domain-containing protein [Vagococcus hydrophili]